MASNIWQTTFDVVGLATYLTIMTGELPDRKLLSAARSGSANLVGSASEPQPADESGDLAHPVATTDVR